MHFDHSTFVDTARAVAVFNEYCRKENMTAANIEDFMYSLAYRELHKAGYVSTMGFVLTACDSVSYPGELYVVASVSAYTMRRFLDQLQAIGDHAQARIAPTTTPKGWDKIEGGVER